MHNGIPTHTADGSLALRCIACGSGTRRPSECACPGGGEDPGREAAWEKYRERVVSAEAVAPHRGKAEARGEGEDTDPKGKGEGKGFGKNGGKNPPDAGKKGQIPKGGFGKCGKHCGAVGKPHTQGFSGSCHLCGQFGHRATDCRSKGKGKNTGKKTREFGQFGG